MGLGKLFAATLDLCYRCQDLRGGYQLPMDLIIAANQVTAAGVFLMNPMEHTLSVLPLVEQQIATLDMTLKGFQNHGIFFTAKKGDHAGAGDPKSAGLIVL